MSGYTDITQLENTRNCLRRIARHDEPQFSKDSILNVMEKFVKTVSIMDDTILVPCRLMDRQVGDSTDITPISGKDVTSNQHSQHQVPYNCHGHVACKSKNVHEFLNSSELFNLYNMLNALKNDLLWTTSKDDNEDDQEQHDIDGKYGNHVNDFNANAVITLNAGTEQQQQQQQQQQHQPNNSKTDQHNTAGSNNNNNNNGNINGNNNACNVVIVATKNHIRRPSTASMASIASVSQMSDTESDISNENDSGVEMLDANTINNTKNGDGATCSSSSSSSSSSGSEKDIVQLKKSNATDKATELAKRCRRHLNGLYKCLEQMTEAANYLTARYQSDIGGGSL